MTEIGEYWRNLLERTIKKASKVKEYLEEADKRNRAWRHCMDLIRILKELAGRDPELGPDPGHPAHPLGLPVHP
jgi:hypothetical protein